MLEGIVATILSNYLGKYIQGLERENLKIALRSGEVELENLELRKETLDDFDLPITVKESFLGKLRMTIPWKALGSEPALIRIERLYLIIQPTKQAELNHEKEELRAQKTKLSAVALAELLGKTKVESASESESDDDHHQPKQPHQNDKQNQSFTQRMITKVVDNLQIFIDKVHIRYEDDRTNPDRPFAFGITLESLHSQSTDGNWNPTFLHHHSPLVHKLIELKNFAMYWDSNTKFIDYYNSEDMAEELENLVQTNKRNVNHHYLLNPISSTLRIVINKSETPDMSIPQYALNFMFNKIGVNLEKNQYQDLMDMLSSFSLHRKSSKVSIGISQLFFSFIIQIVFATVFSLIFFFFF